MTGSEFPEYRLYMYAVTPFMIMIIITLIITQTQPPNEFPDWYSNTAITTPYGIPPCIRPMTNFTKHKLNNESWYSPPFYTGPGGYKLQLTVDANGRSTFKGSHLSIGVHLMKGDNDDCLAWPFNGSIDVKLLNWIEDKNHINHTFFAPNDSAHIINRVINGVRSDDDVMYKNGLLTHHQLEYNNDNNTQYLMEDVLCLIITGIQVQSGE